MTKRVIASQKDKGINFFRKTTRSKTILRAKSKAQRKARKLNRK